ncbi:hypothetical protein SS50377_26883 [Spironucleus salmonicida]|uniref:Uncharacterized protein n=2 Tax=Spironucleus salmonicida TaxID=348837 RepID=V6M2D2_9EUKA|nr:hypothetical protein SS50377_26870 [Spironucleus salmonicida]KAH0570600.1 hypothetical protein SS50377_26883 [Spironucleus salmonicida]|eukprot:EST47394.1 Hypothetical protein SS50377_12381 [Spironucleus salmonicida]
MFAQKQISLPQLAKSSVFSESLLSSQNRQKFLKEAFRTRSQLKYIGQSDHFKIVQQQELAKSESGIKITNQDGASGSTKHISIYRNPTDIALFRALKNRASTVIYCFNICRNKEAQARNILRPTDAVSALVRLDKMRELETFQQEYQKRKILKIRQFHAGVERMIYKRRLEEAYDRRMLRIVGQQLTAVENQVNELFQHREDHARQGAVAILRQ